MKISVSNIAWDIKYDEEVAKILKKNKIHQIDIAPSKYFSELKNIPNYQIKKIKDFWRSNEIKIIGMQSLLYNKDKFNIFGSKKIRMDMLQYLKIVANLGAKIGAKKLVFGSPKNRDIKHLKTNEAEDLAVDFFYRLGSIAKEEGVYFCLEPNPKIYNCNFMTNFDETLKIVKKVGSKNIKIQIDTGELIINQIKVDQLKKNKKFVGHIHLSEPYLMPLHDQKSHKKIGFEIKNMFNKNFITIEMLAKRNFLINLSNSIKFAKKHYG